ncbi:MAG: ATP-binding cassette domain-containing protein [Nitrososphaerota archaeon]|nr:ATP-binding cassette domain-containing protein [Candidatus Bathyarchaeota archaeon]MDW8061824.1 ATP-binding cassette domain-containing protein [Nitrososphaerota archaeon]
MHIVSIEDLWFRYRGSDDWILRGVSLDIGRGEFVVVTGRSGCGKTTLCRCLNGLIPQFYEGELKGSITVAGLDVTKTPVSRMASIVGMVFQNPSSQLFMLTVERDVAFGLENLGVPKDEIRKRVNWALEMLGIPDLRFRAPHELSGGQQQRVAIAAILAMQPQVIILDEPTAYLDPYTSLSIFNLLKELNSRLKLTVILVEHKLEFASSLADRIIVMDGGRIVVEGDPREVFMKDLSIYGVRPPSIPRLFLKLAGCGLQFKRIPLTVEEAVNVFREVHLKVDRS